MKARPRLYTLSMLLLATIIAMGLAWGTTSVALADEIQCTGAIGAVKYDDDIAVPDGASCTLTGTETDGNIKVYNNATLLASGVKVNGNIQAEGAASVTVNNNANVGGNIQVKQGGSASVVNVVVGGDIQYEENKGMLTANSNTVDGNIQIFKNSGGVTVNNNVIEGNLQCKENQPPPTGSGNQADNLEDQCAGMGGGGSPQPTVTPQPDPGDDDEMYGVVISFPAGLIGTWVIGGLEFEATSETEFDRNGRQFAVGVTVEVEYKTQGGVRYAEEIEIIYGSDDDDDDDDKYGSSYGAEGQAYGRLDTKGGQPGTWVIGGIQYSVTEGTELDDDDELIVGERVKVEYVVRSDGSRVAHEIEDTDDDGDVSSDGHSKLVGFIQAMPEGARAGVWKVAGLEFVAGPGTEYEQDHGVFAIGAYVEVEYFLDGETRRIHEIETEVPPGAGDNNRYGKIQSIGGLNQAAAAALNASVWQIDGVAYSVTPSTQLLERGGDLVVGATVVVNSYTVGDTQVATRIQTFVEASRICLPVMLK